MKADTANDKPRQESEVTKSGNADGSRLREGSDREGDSSESAANLEVEERPEDDVITEDCVAFLRNTTSGATGPSAECPHCPANDPAAEVLRFENLKIERVSPSREGCEVTATIHATFRPSRRAEIVGGLTAWISAETKEQYLRGEVPQDEQSYKVNASYRRSPGGGWRAVEFN